MNLVTDAKKIGIIGDNGVGKTTFLRLIAGHLDSDSGTINIKGDSYFINFELSKYRDFTPNDLLDLCRTLNSFNFSKLKYYIDALGLSSYINVLIQNLSRGTQKKVALLIGLLSTYSILLIDEPFEALDQKSNSNLVTIFREESRGLIIVSHEIELLYKSVDEVYEIKNKRLKLHCSS